VDVIFELSPAVFAFFLPSEAAVDAFYAGISPAATLAQFYSFGLAAVGLTVLVRLLHGRGFWSLIGDGAAAWTDLKRVGLGVAFVLLAIELLPPWIAASEAPEMRDFGTWAFLVPVALTALLVQVGTEELFFRGYLQQQLACLSRARWVWMGIPSILFGAVHYWNGHGPSDGAVWAVWAGLLGLACADLTARTGNLGAAIGLHLANNAFALLLYAVEDWPLSGLALFVYPYEDPQSYDYALETLLSPWMFLHVLTMAGSVLVMWLAARIAIRR
jgi:uncharacterized protein